ncbi:octaprenyl-diphosphate synthase [Pseudomonas sp. gcc21]|uniref:polyprenyl synthetase family protein n=1 Tax=Pseudomonas sp. gcc21 TaxID=2726989 RepID=UPI001451A413|nr:polyprenyl synthetase family protein [Pseudomonas sp. gcc21]QJD59082.1 octaprenyl-diphosphate synthase [Pseudomonas sp. gcc21]
MTTLPFYTAVTEDFEAVNQLIMRQLQSRVPLVEKIGSYIISAGGKRLRPLVVLLSARACGMKDPRQHSLATIIEFLHTATLLHDDVVDTSDLRRGRSTANALWGNAPSVLVGDFLFTRAFELMVEMGDMEIMRVLANATNVVAEGEVLQLTKVRDANTDEATYMKVIRSKTAMLFEASSHTGAMLAGASAAQTEALRRYGDALGIAFQLIDDLLDYSGDAEAMGKNVGDDLAEGKPTLPLIYTMREGTEAQAQLVRKAIQKGGADEIEAIQAAVRASGALEYTEKLARKMSEEAVELLQVLPESEFKDALEQLARFAVDRKY